MGIYKNEEIPDNIDGVDVIQECFMACEALSHRKEVVRYEFGNSMFPILQSGQFCKLVPLKENETIEVGDCVYSLIDGTPNTHMVWAKHQSDEGIWYCIATTQGKVVGWTQEVLAKAYGIPYKVEEPEVEKISSLGGLSSSYGISDMDISNISASSDFHISSNVIRNLASRR